MLDEVHEQLGQFADALNDNRDLMRLLLLAVLLDRGEEGRPAPDGHGRRPGFMNFLEALIERHRMPAIFRIREPLRASCGTTRTKLLPVEVTSAVELDDATVQSIGERIGEQTGRTGRALEPRRSRRSSAGSSCAWATSSSTPRSGTDSNNFESKSRRRSAARACQGATHMQIKPDEITSILKSRIEGLDTRAPT